MNKIAASGPLLLDTHVAVWLAEGNIRMKPYLSSLSSSFRQTKLCISAISAWEIGLLVSKNRLALVEAPLVWFSAVVRELKLQVFDITPEIAIMSSFLPGKIHVDPADRLPVGTSMAHSQAIIT